MEKHTSGEKEKEPYKGREPPIEPTKKEFKGREPPIEP